MGLVEERLVKLTLDGYGGMFDMSFTFIHMPDEVYTFIDGDCEVYTAALAIDQETAADEPISHVLHSVKKMLEDIQESCPSNHERVYLTSNDKSNFRFTVANTPVQKRPRNAEPYELLGYKASRADKKKPYHYQLIRNYLVEYHDAIIVEGMEADDMLTIQASKVGRISTIVTRDKDLFQACCDVYRADRKTMYRYKKEWGSLGKLFLTDKGKLYGRCRAWFFAQLLLGDGIDNIPGVRGYGDKTTYKLLKDCKAEQDYFDKTWEVYQEKFEANAKNRYLEVAALLWMITNDVRDIRIYLESTYDF